jgi:uncharacterized alpha/beta hydrolase family protein
MAATKKAFKKVILAKKIKDKAPTGKLNKEDQETIVRFDRTNKEASLFTYSKPLQKHMIKLGAEINFTNSFGGMDFTFPKSWFRIPLVPRSEREEIV